MSFDSLDPVPVGFDGARRPSRISWPLVLAGAALALVAGCSHGSSGSSTAAAAVTMAPPPGRQGPPELGDPLPGLTRAEVTAFFDGRDSFSEIEVAPKLGPLFNARSCAECHALGAVGGAGAQAEMRFGRLTGGVFDPLASEGGSLLQLFATSPDMQENLPRDANVVGLRQTTALFGAGLVEAIPDGQILSYAAFQQATFPSMAGHPVTVTSASDGKPHTGRFGWKAQQALLLDFAADAYNNEMGVTSRLFPLENRPNAPAVLVPNEDPDDQDITKFATFMRFLGAPRRGPETDQARAGEQVFSSISCAACHRPGGYTAVSANAAIDGQPVHAFSDFLVHDIGTGDGIAAGDAGPNEFRTAPLWGLRAGAPFMHDGTAGTTTQAILRHGGQAAASSAAFQALSDTDRAALLAYLDSL